MRCPVGSKVNVRVYLILHQLQVSEVRVPRKVLDTTDQSTSQ